MGRTQRAGPRRDAGRSARIRHPLWTGGGRVDRSAGHAAVGHNCGRPALTALRLARLGPGREGAAGGGELTEQLRWLPVAGIALLRVLVESRKYGVQADLVGIKHRATAAPGKTIA